MTKRSREGNEIIDFRRRAKELARGKANFKTAETKFEMIIISCISDDRVKQRNTYITQKLLRTELIGLFLSYPFQFLTAIFNIAHRRPMDG